MAVHFKGLEEYIDPKLLNHHRRTIEKKKYADVPYLEFKQLAELVPKKMARLDQLPKFQDAYNDMPKEF